MLACIYLLEILEYFCDNNHPQSWWILLIMLKYYFSWKFCIVWVYFYSNLRKNGILFDYSYHLKIWSIILVKCIGWIDEDWLLYLLSKKFFIGLFICLTYGGEHWLFNTYLLFRHNQEYDTMNGHEILFNFDLNHVSIW